MALIVQKFGGTSVGSPEKICLIADRISKSYYDHNQMVVVVSAMGDTTDELIQLAQRVSVCPPHREMDMLLTAGERISMSLLSMALADRKVLAISLTGSQSGIITDQSHRRARILKILGDRVRAGLSNNKVVIVAGFQGVSESREVTTLGRGGSDTSAVALAAILRADRCEIYTDVDGVFSADPRRVPQAKLWKRVSHDVMVELATRGAGVLHPRSVELAKQYQVPLRVKNSLNDHEGTMIGPRKSTQKADGESDMEEFGVTGTTFDSNKFLVRVKLSRSTVLNSLWDLASHLHLSVVAPVFSEGEVWFFSDREAEGEWRRSLEELVRDGFIQSYRLCMETVPLSVVGDRFSQDGKALYEVISVLEKENIQVTLGSASALAITVGVSQNRAEDGVKALHKEFLEDRV